MHRSRIRTLRLRVELPKSWPEVVFERMHSRVAGHYCSAERPLIRMFHESGLKRVLENVMTCAGKRVVVSFLLFEHMVMGLMLEYLRREFWLEIRSQESHAVELIGIQTQSHPDQMQMIRHEAVGRAK